LGKFRIVPVEYIDSQYSTIREPRAGSQVIFKLFESGCLWSRILSANRIRVKILNIIQTPKVKTKTESRQFAGYQRFDSSII